MNPYTNLPAKHFWSAAVAKRNMFDISDLWTPKIRFGKSSKVATYGSCFAQHIGKALRSRGYNWHITETAAPGLSQDDSQMFNYGAFSSRTGNIYTVSLLKQWLDWAEDNNSVPNEYWERDGRIYDPFRPNIEPNGFVTVEEMIRSRLYAIECFRKSVVESDVFVFTLGLTESWTNSKFGYEYPMCPGTVAGTFNSEIHKFVKQDYPSIKSTLVSVIRRMRLMNSRLKFILTVSPVPLTATMSGNHVLVATMESKSVLRAVAGAIRDNIRFVDYFPSYEIINATPFRGTFFESNQRSVNPFGVTHVMNCFFDGLSMNSNVSSETQEITSSGGPGSPLRKSKGNGVAISKRSADVVCEEELLSSFGKDK